MHDKPMQESDNQSSNSEPPHQKASVSRAAIASLGFGILIFIPFHSLLAIGFGIAAKRTIRRGEGKYRGGRLATVGILLGVASIILGVSLSGLYRLEPDESAIIFRLGQIKEVVETPGTNFKVPILETAVVLSTKDFEWQSEIFEARTSNGGRISLRGRLVGRICSPAQFYITFAGSQKRVGDFLEKNFQVKVLDELKKYSLAEIISGMTNIAWQNAVNTELNELLSKSGFCMSDGSQRYEIMETWGD